MPSTIASSKPTDLATLKSIVTLTIAVAVLYFAKDVLIPFALALLVSFLLAPPINWLEKAHLGRIASVLMVLILAFGATGAIVWLGMTQFADMLTKVPQYQQNLHRKITAMHSPAGSALTKALTSIQQLEGDITNVDPSSASSSLENVKPRSEGPIAVEVVNGPPGVLGSLTYVGYSLMHLLGTAAAVLIFALFMMIQRGDIRNRFIHLIGTNHLSVMTIALDDAARGISRYLLTQLLINMTFGLLLGFGLFWIGVPNAPFWGVLGTILRFIPYVGTLVAGLCPLILSVAVFDGWTKPFFTFGLFAGIELAMSAAIEPWLYGAHTGISSLAILVSTAFWTWLWGPVGLVLSTPLTVCLLVLGRYVPAMQFLNVLLGEKIDLPIEACYYQRLLAMDDNEAQEITEKYVEEKSVIELFDMVLIPALTLAEQDRHQKDLTAEHEQFIYQSTKLIIEDLVCEWEQAISSDASPGRSTLLCIPARDGADELVGLMVEIALSKSGVNVKSVALGTQQETFDIVQEEQADTLLISALPPFALMHARSLCRRIRRRFPQMKVVLGLWGATGEMEKLQKRIGLDCFDSVVTEIRAAELYFAPLSQNSVKQTDSLFTTHEEAALHS